MVLEDDELLDYDAMEKLAKEVHPKMIIGGTSAYSRIIDFERMAAVAHEVGALLMIDMAHFAGLVAGENIQVRCRGPILLQRQHIRLFADREEVLLCVRKNMRKRLIKLFSRYAGGRWNMSSQRKRSPLGRSLTGIQRICEAGKENEKVLSDELQNRGIRVISGGTDTHVLLADMRAIGITGKTAQTVLDEIGITANKNTIPFETLSPFVTSGIRLGSPALTTRGLVEEDFKEIADIISTVVKNTDKDEVKNHVLKECQFFVKISTL